MEGGMKTKEPLYSLQEATKLSLPQDSIAKMLADGFTPGENGGRQKELAQLPRSAG